MPWPGVIAAYRPYLPVTDRTPVVTLLEGGTPLIPAPRLGRELGVDLYLKFEGLNPTGSFKDRGMTVAVSKALEEGARAVVCASTGNTSASAAAYAARAGVPAYVVVPDGAIALGKLAQAVAYGAQVLQIAGNFDEGLALVRRLSAERPGIALVNSVNPMRLQGQKTAAFEVVDALGAAPAALAIPVGNAGNITAYWMGFKEYGRGRPVMLGFQAAGAAPLVHGRPVEHPETVATAIRIGNPASWSGAVAAAQESGGGFWAVTDDEILEAYRLIASAEGVFAEPASCASIAGLRRLAREGALARFRGERVVAVLTGHGLKDPGTALKVSRDPLRIPAAYEALVEALGV
ncbi:threonine synthase [Caldinitratiruptor microaerophilus]|uniref:Threonine synthase n=1 Tax=Caldinitratiruptor microaerophilus TaxID=671077 RepID=A0AA35G677_9FIRM|nr:threonine synthase [Caldinitratiruptor microaerophilus]BDG60841.1 threonine synthase [Caldinitratiruptor microaerophilus]